MPDARVQLVVACPCGRIVVKQGRTLVYETPADPPKRATKVGRESAAKPAAATAPTTLTPAPLKPQAVGGEPFPPPYLAVTTGPAYLKIEAGLGSYEVTLELYLPRQLGGPARPKPDR